MEIPEIPKCEICGKPAYYAMRDFFVNESFYLRIKEFKPAPDIHYFCKEHNRESQEIDITLSPLTQFYKSQK